MSQHQQLDVLGGGRADLWVPETPQMSGDLLVFVNQSAEPVVPSEAHLPL
jgi:hypothetical protein